MSGDLDVPLEVLAKVVKTYRDYQVQVNGEQAEMFGPNFDEDIDLAVKNKNRKTLIITVRSVAETARSIEGTSESEPFFKFFRSKLGKELFEVISTPEDEAERIIHRGEVLGFGEARMLAAYIELFHEAPEHISKVEKAQLLLDTFEAETSPES